MTASDSHKSWRPLSTVTLRWNHWLHGYEPYGFHVANVVLHSVSCLLVYGIGLLVLPDASTAAVGGALFAAHPLHSEPVASIVGRADVLCGALTLGAVYVYYAATSRAGARAVAAYGLGFAAALAKDGATKGCFDVTSPTL